MSIHVTPRKDGWQVKRKGTTKAHRVVETQKEAIEIARTVAKNQDSDIKIHGKNGRIREGRNYSK